MLVMFKDTRNLCCMKLVIVSIAHIMNIFHLTISFPTFCNENVCGDRGVFNDIIAAETEFARCEAMVRSDYTQHDPTLAKIYRYLFCCHKKFVKTHLWPWSKMFWTSFNTATILSTFPYDALSCLSAHWPPVHVELAELTCAETCLPSTNASFHM